MISLGKAAKCVLWGMGAVYETLLNQILFEIHKGNIVVEAVVCREEDKYCKSRDGFPVISPKELILDSFEYLIITSKIYFNEIKKEAIKLGIEQ